MKSLTRIAICMLFLAFFCSEACAVPSGQVVKADAVRQVLTDYIKNRTASLGLEVNVKRIGYGGDLSLPAGQVDYEVVAPQQWEGWGSANLALIVRVNGQVKRNLPIKVEVEALTEMVVTTRQLERGQVIAASDVALQKRDLATAGGKICNNIAEVVGMRLKNTIRGNVPLRGDQLEKIPIVKNGQLVTILLENDSLRITATGRCKGTGGAGDLVIVQNMSSKKEIPARIVDAGMVRVEF
ncbi:MAG: flagellar basal body P-ring formation protein FlgA [Geobacter sp.]|nr:flagellar basal body P-ring formation protein FlgA [Geobacter sp.]